MIAQIEFVSSHFGYLEDYVLEKTPEWIKRKYMQAAREKHEQHRVRILESFKGLSLMVDSFANKGKGADSILPPPFDEAVKEKQKKVEENDEYLAGEWWLRKEDEKIPAQN